MTRFWSKIHNKSNKMSKHMILKVFDWLKRNAWKKVLKCWFIMKKTKRLERKNHHTQNVSVGSEMYYNGYFFSSSNFGWLKYREWEKSLFMLPSHCLPLLFPPMQANWTLFLLLNSLIILCFLCSIFSCIFTYRLWPF